MYEDTVAALDAAFRQLQRAYMPLAFYVFGRVMSLPQWAKVRGRH